MDIETLYSEPDDPRAVFVFGHGAGAGMRHAFMDAVAGRLSDRDVAVLRYSFPYMREGRRAPDAERVLTATVREAVRRAREHFGDRPLIAGGKSMGGRMTSKAAAADLLDGVAGLAFFGFPLHAAGRPSADRGDHLAKVGLPMLFLQGTRDKLADLDLLQPLLERLHPAPRLHVLDGADHGFQVLKRSGRTQEEVLDEAVDAFVDWVEGC